MLFKNNKKNRKSKDTAEKKIANEQEKAAISKEKQDIPPVSAGVRPTTSYTSHYVASTYEEPPEPEKEKLYVQLLHGIGNVLYFLGLYAEIKARQILRAIKTGVIAISQVLGLLFSFILNKVIKNVKKLVQEIKAPFKRIQKGIKNMRAMAKEQAAQGTDKKQIWSYFFGGIKNNKHFVENLIAFFLPLMALGIFIFTTNSLLSMKYALFVTVGDTEIGYVENETVLEDGLNLLRMRLSLAQDQDIDQWEFTPTLSVSATDTTLDKVEVANKILESSPEDLQEGYGIYVDGLLVGATTNADEINEFLEDKKQPYREISPTASVEFVRNVEVSDKQEVFLAGTVQSSEILEEQLSTDVSPEILYTAKKGETLSEIARENNITLENLLVRNPDLETTDSNYVPNEGEVLVIQNAEPYLQIKTVFQEQVSEAIPYETIKTEVTTRPRGQQATVQQGKDGEELVMYELSYIDGELVSRVRIDELSEVTVEVQNKIIEIGTNAAMSNLSGGGAGFIWPVPDAKYSSRGISSGHRGLDINAPYGTPIYAIGNGVVVAAGWHYSYGNYIEIQHADGILSLYGHNSEILVSVGDTVEQGQLIAYMGSTGNSTGNHLHLEIQVNGALTDPYNYVIAPWSTT